MTDGRILDSLLSKVRQLDSPESVDSYSGRTSPLPVRCSVGPHEPWNREGLERRLDAAIPPDLALLWDRTSKLRLFEDIRYGQWGLVIWGPAHALRESPLEIVRRKKDFRRGDLVVGEFLGDAELLVVRCDRGADDFGNVTIALEIDPRDEWPIVGKSFIEFLDKYVAAAGDKFWEPETKECTSCRGGMPVMSMTCPHCGEPQGLAP